MGMRLLPGCVVFNPLARNLGGGGGGFKGLIKLWWWKYYAEGKDVYPMRVCEHWKKTGQQTYSSGRSRGVPWVPWNPSFEGLPSFYYSYTLIVAKSAQTELRTQTSRFMVS